MNDAIGKEDVGLNDAGCGIEGGDVLSCRVGGKGEGFTVGSHKRLIAGQERGVEGSAVDKLDTRVNY